MGVDGPVYDLGAAPATAVASGDGLLDDAFAAAGGVVGHVMTGLLGDSGGADRGGLVGDVEELFMEQRLDHFDRQNSRTFSQRYFINDRLVDRRTMTSFFSWSKHPLV